MAQANTIYPKGKQYMLSGAIDLQDNTIFCSLVNESYTYAAGDTIYQGTVSPYQVGATGTMTIGADDYLNGTFDAADQTFSSVAAGSTVEGVVIFKSGSGGGGTPTDNLLIAYFTTGSGGRINLSTNGGDITINWNASGIFSL